MRTTPDPAPVSPVDDGVIAPSGETSSAQIGPGRRQLPRGLSAIVIATVALFAVSAVVAPESVSGNAILSMIPFAAILAIVALGQTLVVQQGGIDLSVPGAFSLAVVLITKAPADNLASVAVMAVLAVAVMFLAGFVSGAIVAYVRVAPIVVTLGMNALLIGTTWAVSAGAARPSPNSWYQVATAHPLGIPVPVLIAVVLTVVLTVITKMTPWGRRFEAVGANPRMAAAAGIRPTTSIIMAYAAATALYAVGGILLAGLINTPSISEGNSYLLASVAVVVLGGTSLLGGKGSVIATAIAAIFFTQVDRMALTLGLGPGVQTLIQALALALGVLAHRSRNRTGRRS